MQFCLGYTINSHRVPSKPHNLFMHFLLSQMYKFLFIIAPISNMENMKYEILRVRPFQ